MAIYSIGCAALTEQGFLEAVRTAPDKIDLIVDARTLPVSEVEHFNRDQLAGFLHRARLGYEWVSPLGGWSAADMAWAPMMLPHGVDVAAYSEGRLPRQRVVREDNGWMSQALHDYAWYTYLPKFGYWADWLRKLGEEKNVAVMRPEALWWKCPRATIADWLVTHGSDVTHLPWRSSHREYIVARRERYPEKVQQVWKNWK